MSDSCPTVLNSKTGRQVLREGRVGKAISKGGDEKPEIVKLYNGTIRQFYRHMTLPLKVGIEKKNMPKQFTRAIINKKTGLVFNFKNKRLIGNLSNNNKTINITVLSGNIYAPKYRLSTQVVQSTGKKVKAYWEKDNDLNQDETESLLGEVFADSKKAKTIMKKFYNKGENNLPDSFYDDY